MAADGLLALQALGEADYDLVLMDCQLPNMDGYEATRHIRRPDSQVRDHQVPVIAMTAHAMTGDGAKCLASGMNDYLTKPFKQADLKGMLEKWLAVRPRATVAEGATAEPGRAERQEAQCPPKSKRRRYLFRRGSLPALQEVPFDTGPDNPAGRKQNGRGKRTCGWLCSRLPGAGPSYCSALAIAASARGAMSSYPLALGWSPSPEYPSFNMPFSSTRAE